MTPIQQMLLGAGGAAKKTYMEDLFSTYLHAGNETAKSIVNGVDLTKGGMVWTKGRSHWNQKHYLFDTVRGATKYVKTNESNAEGYDNNTLTSFNNNGFSLGVDTSQNENGRTYSTWSFREEKGFFDVVTYTGTGTAGKTVSHDLGSVPGIIIVKATDSVKNWCVYHQSLGATYNTILDNSNASSDVSTVWNDTAPTSTEFTVGTSGGTNEDGTSYVAYLFAGGESTAATARSVDFDGSDDYLSIASSSDFTLTGDFTMECWFKSDNVSGVHVILNGRGSASSGGPVIYTNGTSLVFDNGTGAVATASSAVSIGQWYHVAGTRSGNNWKLYLNGIQVASGTDSSSYSSDTGFVIGSSWANEYFNGRVSNVRLTKGQVLYTSSFKPTTEPLTTTSQGATASNVKLLCCQNSQASYATVSPGTITASGGPTVSDSISPFDDPAGFKFGKNEDQNVIKTGSYVGNGGTGGPKISLGFEPQWILVKNTSDIGNWYMFDSLRGIANDHNDAKLSANEVQIEETDAEYIDLNATGFQIVSANSNVNTDGDIYIYMAIRRPDGYVGKPADAGTDVFAITAGTSNSDVPGFVSGFPVDYYFIRPPASTSSWWSQARLTGTKTLKLDDTAAETTDTNIGFDFNNGAHDWDGDLSSYQGWLWKRHAGFDVVTYKATGSAMNISHGLSKIPEMYWLKNRDDTKPWIIYHKGLNGGTNPNQYYLQFDADEDGTINPYADAPTATHLNIAAGESWTNDTGDDYLAMLFASVDGISKVGSYTGVSSQLQIRNLGFTPRFLLVKRVDGTGNWVVFDTTRGWGSGDDKKLFLNTSAAQTTQDVGDPVSSGGGGFDLYTGNDDFNNTGNEYIYYAHA